MRDRASAALSVDMKTEKCVNLRKKRDARKARGHMAKRKIPTNMQPWTANINGEEYEYESGITAEVPEEVAALIDFIDESAPKRDPKAAQRAIEDEVTQIVKDNFAGGVGYEETSEVVLLPETSFECVSLESDTIISDSFPYSFEVGQNYIVTFDGETNTYTAAEFNRAVMLTNTSFDDVFAGSGWVIFVTDGKAGLQTLDSSFIGTHTISISGSVHEVHKIDRKFIADMPLYEESGVLSADYNGTALEPNELAELLKTKHCYITKPLIRETRMEILSYSVYRTNNVVNAVKCYFIGSSTGTIRSTQNGEIQGT